MAKKIFNGVLVTLLLICLSLSGCTAIVLAPTTQVIEKAIAVQLEHTQEKLNQQLDLDFQSFAIKHLFIQKQKALSLKNLMTYRVSGTYDLVFQLPDRKLTQAKKPFEVYLQLQKEGKTWRLLMSDNDTKDTEATWHSYLVQ
ncbi:hypothetical protein [Calothrix sp. 336/3]|uniref:hypothetical protein n=1 Tax=Calothrix sp. 336/3 TaxID=1337936 RepID=UPI0035282D92